MIFLIDGLDRLGKSTLCKELQNFSPHYFSIHLGKPIDSSYFGGTETNARLYAYQQSCFKNYFKLLSSDVNVIFDRTHLGECVYSPLYRGYDGEYVFKLEQEFLEQFEQPPPIKLILLIEDFIASRHFVDDGLSFDVTKRQIEQNMFLNAFAKSSITDKRIVCVTNNDISSPNYGSFRPIQDIVKQLFIKYENSSN